MKEKKKRMISLGIGALVFAVWLVILFFEKAIGLSMLLFVVPFSLFLVYILKKNNKIKNPMVVWLLIPIIALASTYFIFDNLFFRQINLLVIPTLYSFMILGLLGENFDMNLHTVAKILSSFISPLSFIREGVINFVNKIKEKLNINTQNKEKTNKIIRAMVITLPVVLIIVVLLSTADVIFAGIFKDIFSMISVNLFNKLICMEIAFFYLIGLFYLACVKYDIKDKEEILQEKVHDNFTIKMLLSSLNIIYVVFCFIQIKALFMRSTTLNYAEYARQGFFQLMLVSVINLVTILIAKKRENKDEIKTNRFINWMSIIMIMFTFVIVISAGMRMHFYESAYGYTLLRLLVYCVLLTESILFIPTILYILNRKINLAKSYFYIMICVYLCMNFANFDNIIAKRNVDRYYKTGKIDFQYLKISTGADATKQILRLLNTSENDVKTEVEKYVKERYKKLEEQDIDFRDYNISKMCTKRLLKVYKNL